MKNKGPFRSSRVRMAFLTLAAASCELPAFADVNYVIHCVANDGQSYTAETQCSSGGSAVGNCYCNTWDAETGYSDCDAFITCTS